MDKREKANRRAKDAIVAWLVASEQPKSEEEALEAMYAWEELTIDKLLEAKTYNEKKSAYTNNVLTRHMYRCIGEAEKAKT